MLCHLATQAKVRSFMIEYFQSLFDQISPTMAYLVLGVSAFTENVLPPVPGDTVVVLGAYLVSIGQLEFLGVYISTTIGSVAGFITMFLVGKHFGRSFISKKSRAQIFKEDQIKKVEIWFSKWGYWVIFANRFLSGTRSVISLFAGLFHLNIWIVLGLSFLSAAIWNGLLITAGMLVGHNWGTIIDIISQYNKVLIVITVLVVGYFIFRKKRPKIQNDHSGGELSE
jgi:membrane protein DedA with SNARE-associated domain